MFVSVWIRFWPELRFQEDLEFICKKRLNIMHISCLVSTENKSLGRHNTQTRIQEWWNFLSEINRHLEGLFKRNAHSNPVSIFFFSIIHELSISLSRTFHYVTWRLLLNFIKQVMNIKLTLEPWFCTVIEFSILIGQTVFINFIGLYSCTSSNIS